MGNKIEKAFHISNTLECSYAARRHVYAMAHVVLHAVKSCVDSSGVGKRERGGKRTRATACAQVDRRHHCPVVQLDHL